MKILLHNLLKKLKKCVYYIDIGPTSKINLLQHKITSSARICLSESFSSRVWASFNGVFPFRLALVVLLHRFILVHFLGCKHGLVNLLI
ncbi:hypothetical protein ACTNDG_12210 [Clostridium sp. HCP1S3_B4]|uniref:hypothetical protein n=1 Tax=Clostridium sp. HCP1S3_B4 TaxID=3438918 RepID=UPI003F8A89EF